jgi:hypothetical protein
VVTIFLRFWAQILVTASTKWRGVYKVRRTVASVRFPLVTGASSVYLVHDMTTFRPSRARFLVTPCTRWRGVHKVPPTAFHIRRTSHFGGLCSRGDHFRRINSGPILVTGYAKWREGCKVRRKGDPGCAPG